MCSIRDQEREHFLNPRNVGDVAGIPYVGQSGSLTCGATLRISLAIDHEQKITDAKFKAAGCSFLVSAVSLITESIRGKTTGAVASLARSPQGLFSELGEISGGPSHDSIDKKGHCVRLADEALLQAITSFSDAARDEWEGDEALICTCFCVSERTIEREIKERQLHTIAEVTRACKAGAGCQSCFPLIEDILDDLHRSAVL